MTQAIYYVYAYYDQESIPFYIGYGKNGRMFDHLNEAKKFPAPTQGQHKLNKIRKLLSIGKEPKIRVIAKSLHLHEARLLEIILIKEIGRKDLGLGPLTNLTDGGDGVSNPSIENRMERSKRQKDKIACYDKEGKFLFVEEHLFDEKIHSALNKGKSLYTNGSEFMILSPKDDLVKSGVFYRPNKNKCVIIEDGVHKMVSIEDKNRLNLKSMNKGKIAVVDRNGNKFLTDTTDVRISTGEIKIIVGSKKVMKCKTTGKLRSFERGEAIPESYVGQNKGGTQNLVTAVDVEGSKYRVLKTDERLGRTLYPTRS